MAHSEDTNWPSEDFPDEATLYYRVHKNDREDDKLKPGAFKNRPSAKDGMSTNWSKYSTAHQLLQSSKTPSDNIIVGLKAGRVRQVPDQVVEHTPVQPCESMPTGNRAHTDVKGDKSPEARLKLMEVYWVTLRSLNETGVIEEEHGNAAGQ